MSNIYDYLKWRGDLTFNMVPFNTVDNVLFSTLAYIDYHEDDNGRTLAELSERTKEKGLYVSSVDPVFPAKLLTEAGRTKRFADVVLEHYENVYDPIQDIQFAAVHFRIDNRTYIAFRGTDLSLTGWKEDFMMAFTVTHAQELAVQYLEDTIDLSSGQSYYVGGHSKGGNLAIYGSMFLSEEKQEKILRIFSNDGPGFSSDVMNIEGYDRISDRIFKIIPSFSIVGMIFEKDAKNDVIVPSTNIGILQHDLTTWQVVPRGFKTIKELQPTAARIIETLNTWVEDLNMEERTEFVTDFFEAINKEGIEYLTDLANPIKLEMVLLQILRMSKGSKKSAMKFSELALKNMRDDATEYFRTEIKKRSRKKKKK